MYASELAGYVANLKNLNHVSLYAISIQNEPDVSTTYPSCRWTAQQFHDFATNLFNALTASNVASTKIILPEASSWNSIYSSTAMGDPNASIPTPQPVHYRPMFGAFGGALSRGSLTFVSKAGLDAGIKDRFGLAKPLSAVKNVRTVRKQHMVHNHYLPTMEIDAQTYSVRADGQLLTCEPAVSLPMAQRYFLF